VLSNAHFVGKELHLTSVTQLSRLSYLVIHPPPSRFRMNGSHPLPYSKTIISCCLFVCKWEQLACKSFHSRVESSSVSGWQNEQERAETFLRLAIRELFPPGFQFLAPRELTHIHVKMLQNPPISFQNVHQGKSIP
jgi:hypothetical protein